MALDVAGSLQPREVIARILERGVHAMQADRATLSSLSDDHVLVEATHGRDGQVTWVGQRYSLDYFAGQPLVKKAIETMQPTFGGGLASDRAAPEFRQAIADVQHVAVIPLVHGGKAIGMLVLSRYEDRPFTNKDLAPLTLLGAISGLALRNARLFEEGEAARKRADETAARLRAAVEAAEDVASQVQLDQVLGRLLERAVASVGADGASVARLEGEEMVLESTTSGEAVGTRWPIAPKVLAGVKKGKSVELTAAEYTGAPEGLECTHSAAAAGTRLPDVTVQVPTAADVTPSTLSLGAAVDAVTNGQRTAGNAHELRLYPLPPHGRRVRKKRRTSSGQSRGRTVSAPSPHASGTCPSG